MYNPNFRITIEPISEAGKKDFPEELRGGVECQGYVLIADQCGKTEVNVMHMSKSDIAIGISQTPLLLASAHIAKAMREANEMELKSRAFSDLMNKLGR